MIFLPQRYPLFGQINNQFRFCLKNQLKMILSMNVLNNSKKVHSCMFEALYFLISFLYVGFNSQYFQFINFSQFSCCIVPVQLNIYFYINLRHFQLINILDLIIQYIKFMGNRQSKNVNKSMGNKQSTYLNNQDKQSILPNQQTTATQHQKFGGYLDYSLGGNDTLIDYITIEDKRMYFNRYDFEESFQCIIDQYEFINKKPFLDKQLAQRLSEQKLFDLIATPAKTDLLQKAINVIVKVKQNNYQQLSDKRQYKAAKKILLHKGIRLQSKQQKCTICLVNFDFNNQQLQIFVNRQSCFTKLLQIVRNETRNFKKLTQVKSRSGRIFPPKQWKTPFQFLQFQELFFMFKFSDQLELPKQSQLLSNFALPSNQETQTQKNNMTKNEFKKQISRLSQMQGRFLKQQINEAQNTFQRLNFFKMMNKLHNKEEKVYDLIKYADQLEDQQPFSSKEWYESNAGCYILQGTKILCLDENKKVVQRKIESLLQSTEKVQVVSYNELASQFQFKGNLVKILKEKMQISLISISIENEQLISLIVSPQTKIMVNGLFKRASSIKVGEKILFFDKQQLKLMEVIQKYYLRQITYNLFTLQVDPHHNFFANGILTHNRETKPLLAYFFDESSSIMTKTIKCFTNQPLKTITEFQNRTLTLGGIKLDKNLTCGDYRLNQFPSLFAFDSEATNASKFVITQHRSHNITSEQLLIIDSLYNHIQDNFLGIFEGKIIDLNVNFGRFNKQAPSQLLVCRKVYLQKLNYHHNYETFIADDLTGLKRKLNIVVPEQKQELWKKTHSSQLFPLFMYTQLFHSRIFNSFLRQKTDRSAKSKFAVIGRSLEMSEKQLYYIINSINKCLDELPSVKYQESIVYRGVSSIKIENAFCLTKNQDNEKFLMFTAFTSTSSKKEVAQRFIPEKTNGVLITIRTFTGKAIHLYSQFQHQFEVLLKPYTYFLINSFDLKTIPQTMQLQEIPFPCTNRQNLIFWVDDQPENNQTIIKAFFTSEDIEVIQVRSTRLMKVLLCDFFGFFNILKKKVVIISDLARYQNGRWNYYAGVQLFQLIYNRYGMSNKAFIYTMSDQYKLEAVRQIRQLGIARENWVVSTSPTEICEEVLRLLRND